MKCPKCGYLGFETSDRCRNCGYDFSLAVSTDSSAELPLRSGDGPGAPLADLDLAEASGPPAVDAAPNFDLDRVIGADAPPPPARRTPAAGLPLFPGDVSDDGPIAPPPRARAPLAVRRTTPETPRARPRVERPRLDMDLDPADAAEPALAEPERLRPSADTLLRPDPAAFAPATSGARLLAAIVDFVVLSAIDVIVVYLTLALVGLDRSSFALLPPAPLAGFLAILNGGYLVAFVAASGQTLGKMMTGIRVMGDDGERVDVRGAVLRAAGCGVSLLTLGIGYLPAFLTASGRALQDRVAGTRVVSAR